MESPEANSKQYSRITLNSFGKFPPQHLHKIKKKDYFIQRHIV